MSSKKKSPDALLQRAEHQFHIGNYPVAKKEYEKANRALNRDDIAEKIAHCDQALAQEKAQELIKKGKKSIGKKSFKEALRCFEEAYAVTKEAWLVDKIEELRINVSGLDALTEAEQAEQQKDYRQAAELYRCAGETRHDPKLSLREAHCYVMDNQFDAALAIYAQTELTADRDLYNCGFASAKVEKYYDCLRVWDRIRKTNRELESQKQLIRQRLAVQLYGLACHDLSVCPEPVYEQAAYLAKAQSQIEVSPLLKHARMMVIKKLWQEEKYLEIHELAQQSPNTIDTTMLGLYTRLYFRLAYNSPDFIDQFLTFWMTGIYQPALFEPIDLCGIDPELLRDQFIQAGEDLIRSYIHTGVQGAEKSLAVIQKQKALLERLSVVYQQANAGGWLCTPQFAARFGLADEICQLIAKHSDCFSHHAEYLETGAYYCKLGESLIHLDCGNYQQAYDSLKNSANKNLAEFDAYCQERISFEYGVYCIDHDIDPPSRIFANVADLFKKAPELEAAFIEKTRNADSVKALKRHERGLKEIMVRHPSPGIKKALSYVLICLCIDMSNEKHISNRAAEAMTKKALELDPENEMAKTTLIQIEKEFELDELHKAMNRIKMNKAIKIVTESKHPETKEAFFDYVKFQLNSMNDGNVALEMKRYLLNELVKWCARVDDTHPIIEAIDHKLHLLEKD